MSTRTIIEINHDHIRRLEKDPAYLKALMQQLGMSGVTEGLNKHGPHDFCAGVRILGQRHHSETLNLKVE
jgi:hypothetical protein